MMLNKDAVIKIMSRSVIVTVTMLGFVFDIWAPWYSLALFIVIMLAVDPIGQAKPKGLSLDCMAVVFVIFLTFSLVISFALGDCTMSNFLIIFSESGAVIDCSLKS